MVKRGKLLIQQLGLVEYRLPIAPGGCLDTTESLRHSQTRNGDITMNRAEKKEKAKAKKRANKLARYKRNGNTSWYARKLQWRLSNIGGAPLSTVFGFHSWEQSCELFTQMSAA